MGEAQPINREQQPGNPATALPINRKQKPAKAVAKKQRQPLSKTLPTDRINFSKQLDIIRAYAASGASGRSVTNAEVGEMMKMQPSTVSLTNAFLSSIGLIVKAEGGYTPAPEVLSFLRANEWTPDTAGHELAPKIKQAWFAEVLLPKVAFAPMTEDAALGKLADAAQAGAEYRGQLRILLDYLQASGLIDREGGQITLPKNVSASAVRPESPIKAQEPEPTGRGVGAAATLFSRTTEGAVHFNVSVKVDMKELEGWKPERIAAFFSGIAQVLAAKADVERKAV